MLDLKLQTYDQIEEITRIHDEISCKRKIALAISGTANCSTSLLRRTFANSVKRYEELHEVEVGCMVFAKSGNVEDQALDYCLRNEVPYMDIKTHFAALGKLGAMYSRTVEISKIADGLMCYWDFVSKEVKLYIGLFRQEGKPIMTFCIKPAPVVPSDDDLIDRESY